MSKKYSLIIFDWEGTLNDGRGHQLSLLAKAATRLGYSAFDWEQARQLPWCDNIHLVQALYPELSSHQKQTLLSVLRDEQCHTTCYCLLFEGVTSLLEALHNRGILVGIATSCGRAYLDSALEKAGIRNLVDFSRTPDESPAKPAPDMLLEITSLAGLLPSDALMVGDSASDYLAAQNAGMDFLGLHFDLTAIGKVDEQTTMPSVVASIADLREKLLA